VFLYYVTTNDNDNAVKCLYTGHYLRVRLIVPPLRYYEMQLTRECAYIHFAYT